MYLISLYFDKKTEDRIQSYISAVAKKSGNYFMLEKKVPPHLTVSAFETKEEEKGVQSFKEASKYLERGTLLWCSVGMFLPYVIYLTPVLNTYLSQMSQTIYESVRAIEKVSVSPFYRPFQWLPHTTIGKTLSKAEMEKAFQVMQSRFAVFEGTAVEIGLAKTNPYEEFLRIPLI